MDRCKGRKRNGDPCSLTARGSDGYCWAHSPENASKRRENASKGGKVRTGGEITAIKDRIRELAEGVVDGKVDKGRASVAFTGYGVLTRVIELERRVKEEHLLEELQQRLSVLESRTQRVRGM